MAGSSLVTPAKSCLIMARRCGHRVSKIARFIIVAPACALMDGKHILYQAAPLSATVLRVGAQPHGPAYEAAKPLTNPLKSGKVIESPRLSFRKNLSKIHNES